MILKLNTNVNIISTVDCIHKFKKNALLCINFRKNSVIAIVGE